MPGIIVEGAEQQGKSTICRLLNERLNIPIIHMNKNYGFIDGKFDYVESYFVSINGTNQIIFDRHYLSEIVYGKYFNRNNITETMRKEIELRLNNSGYMIVLLSRPGYEWIDRDEMVDKQQNDRIIELYNEEIVKCETEYLIINTLHPSKSIDLIESYYNKLCTKYYNVY